MANVERYCAKGIFDPAAYSQAVKVSGSQTTLYLAGQVLVELLPRLEAGAALEGVKEHAGGLLRLLPERFVHGVLLSSATRVRGAPASK